MDANLLQNINFSIGYVAKFIEVCGVLTILIGGALAVFRFVTSRTPTSDGKSSYENLRGSLGQAILLGLEFLVAGDIIGTVAVEPTFRSLGVLGLIVLIRTFLSFSLEVEIKGRWPWSGPGEGNAARRLS
jgi:uncharacterized membrane protein